MLKHRVVGPVLCLASLFLLQLLPCGGLLLSSSRQLLSVLALQQHAVVQPAGGVPLPPRYLPNLATHLAIEGSARDAGCVQFATRYGSMFAAAWMRFAQCEILSKKLVSYFHALSLRRALLTDIFSLAFCKLSMTPSMTLFTFRMLSSSLRNVSSRASSAV